MQYAVISTGNKQYIVKPGDEVVVDAMTSEVGSNIVFDDVRLFVDDENVEIGTPTVSRKVEATVISNLQSKKVVGMRNNAGGHQRKFGHRQQHTKVKINSIQ